MRAAAQVPPSFRIGVLSVTQYRLSAMASVTKRRNVTPRGQENHSAIVYVFGPDDLIGFGLGMVLPKRCCQFGHDLEHMVQSSFVLILPQSEVNALSPAM